MIELNRNANSNKEEKTMVCPNCKNELTLPPRAYLNLVGYQEEGSILVASKCCNAGYLVKKEVKYDI